MARTLFRKKKRRSSSTLESSKRPPRSHLARVNVVYGVVFLAFGSLVFRLGYLQVTQGATYRAEAQTSAVQSVPVLPARGRIYDTNGNLLAYDEPSYNVYYTQQQNGNQNLSAIAKILAPEFKTTPKKIEETVQKQSQFATIQLFKSATASQLAFISEHQDELPGVNIELASQREYPYGTLAGHVLGYISPITSSNRNYYVNQKHYLLNQLVGSAGIEEQYESLLQGKVGEQVMQVNMQGTSMKALGFNPAPVAGDNIQLTLDGHLQAMTQNEVLNEYHTATQKYGYIPDVAAVALNPKTGGVLAMVSYPYVDPNWYTTPGLWAKHSQYMATSGAEMNDAIQNPNYPGSSMKPSTLVAGLTYGAVTPSFTVDDFGSLMVQSQRMFDDAAFGVVDAVHALAVSSEVYYYTVGLRLGHWFNTSYSSGGDNGGLNYTIWEHKYFIKGLLEMYHTEWLFGLGPKTGIDLPGEQAANFYDLDIGRSGSQAVLLNNIPKLWAEFQKNGSLNTGNTESATTLAQAATGQEQQVTPIQLATYVATLANNGVKVQPHLLEAVYKPGMESHLTSADKPIETVKPKTTKLPFKLSTFEVVRQGMEGVTKYGTASASFTNVPYTVAGKTGTAQIYLKGKQVDNAVFIAYAPVNNPQIAVAVMMPGGSQGAYTAAPIARVMMDTYFKEHHEFFPKNQWQNTSIPSNWKQTPAYTEPESAK